MNCPSCQMARTKNGRSVFGVPCTNCRRWILLLKCRHRLGRALLLAFERLFAAARSADSTCAALKYRGLALSAGSAFAQRIRRRCPVPSVKKRIHGATRGDEIHVCRVFLRRSRARCCWWHDDPESLSPQITSGSRLSGSTTMVVAQPRLQRDDLFGCRHLTNSTYGHSPRAPIKITPSRTPADVLRDPSGASEFRLGREAVEARVEAPLTKMAAAVRCRECSCKSSSSWVHLG